MRVRRSTRRRVQEIVQRVQGAWKDAQHLAGYYHTGYRNMREWRLDLAQHKGPGAQGLSVLEWVEYYLYRSTVAEFLYLLTQRRGR